MPVVDFLFVIIELFRCRLRSRRYEHKTVEVGVFQKGVGHIACKFQIEGASPTSHCWCRKTRVISLLCDVKISAVHYLVLAQITRVTTGKTDGQNYDSQDRARIAASRCKNISSASISGNVAVVNTFALTIVEQTANRQVRSLSVQH